MNILQTRNVLILRPLCFVNNKTMESRKYNNFLHCGVCSPVIFCFNLRDIFFGKFIEHSNSISDADSCFIDVFWLLLLFNYFLYNLFLELILSQTCLH